MEGPRIRKLVTDVLDATTVDGSGEPDAELVDWLHTLPGTVPNFVPSGGLFRLASVGTLDSESRTVPPALVGHFPKIPHFRPDST